MPANDLETRMWLSGFRIDEELGAGGMGTVFGAWDRLLHRRVALKTLHGDDVEAAVAEARAMAAVHHPHVVTIYGIERDGARTVVVMERIDGTSLDRMIENGKTVSPCAVAPIVRDIAGALGAIHRAGLLHGDVKPSNVLIENESGRVVVTDFGLSSDFEDGPGTTSLRGTPDYLAPERASGQLVPRELRPRQDVYALACTVFELLTGRVPYEGEDLKDTLSAHVSAPIPRASEFVPSIGWRIDGVLARGLAKDPAVRTSSPERFARDLARAVQKGADRARVLVIDDDPLGREYVSSTLAKRVRGAMFQTASDGESGYRAALAYPPDLVLLDLEMPRMNGVELAGLLRATPRLESIPIAIVSGAISEGERRLLARIGVAAFLEKPVTPGHLANVVRDQLGLRDSFSGVGTT